jgi:hypothetical protein
MVICGSAKTYFMTEAKDPVIVVKEQIIQRIVHLRDEKGILDIHLAELYGVETRALKQAVRRNRERFPADDFMFELIENEADAVVSHFVIPPRIGFRRKDEQD